MLTTLTASDIAYLYNELRKASVKWRGRKEVLELSRRKVFVRFTKEGKAVYKFHWQCASCLKWFNNIKGLEVDHIKEIGGISEFAGDWNETIAKIFPRPVENHLQILCAPCHQKKTLAWSSARSLYRRKKI